MMDRRAVLAGAAALAASAPFPFAGASAAARQVRSRILDAHAMEVQALDPEAAAPPARDATLYRGENGDASAPLAPFNVR